jgi:hypothetical protein
MAFLIASVFYGVGEYPDTKKAFTDVLDDSTV